MKVRSQVKRLRSGTEKIVAVWSIGMYSGEDLFQLKPAKEANNPVLSARNALDVQAEFVADPFMIKEEGIWHMFFEVMNAKTKKGEIGLAISRDGLSWSYCRIVLKEPFHLSYPYVFLADGEYYMMPETYQANSIRLYRGDPFPGSWSLVGSILEGKWVDPSSFFFNGMWWMFAGVASPQHDTLELFYSKSISGPWQAHPMSPIVEGNSQIARPGGRVIVTGDRVIRFTQDCQPYYGTRVRGFEICELTVTTYSEREVEQIPVLSAGEDVWNRSGMHHIDPHFVDVRWLACVDGWHHGNGNSSNDA